MRVRCIPAVFAVLTIFAGGAHANPKHVWSDRSVHSDGQWIEKLSVDAGGNIVACGNFSGEVALDQVYSAQGFQDAFVARFDPSGNLLWAHQLGDVRPDRAMDVAVDVSGNVILSGHLSSAMNDADAMIVKYAPDGTQLWFKRFGQGDGHFESAMVVGVTTTKEIIVAGEFDGDFSLGGATLQPTGGQTFFMAKFDENGNHKWSKRFVTTTPYSFNLHGLKTAANGESVLCGTLVNTVDFGNGPLSANGQPDIFLARFDTNGNAMWSQRYGDAGAQEPAAIAINARGQIALAGFTNGSVSFGGPALSAGSDYDPFVVVLNAQASQLWGRIFTGTSNQYPSSVTWASNQDVLVAFHGSGTLNFGGKPLSIIGPSGGVWLTRFLGATGSHRWSETLTASENIDGQIEDSDGKIILGGCVEGDINFGGGTTVGDPNYCDLYLAKFSDAQSGGTAAHHPEIQQNVPNPFNPSTTIPFILSEPGHVRIEIYAVSGQRVALLDAGDVAAGTHSVTWNGRDTRGRAVASGVYFYRLEGSADTPRKMVLLK